MSSRRCSHCMALAAALLLAGCGGAERAIEAPDDDPAVNEALAGQLMSDPDLVTMSGSDTALSGGNPIWAGMPPFERGEREVAAAREDAARLAGGTVRPAPDPQDGDDSISPFARSATALQFASATGRNGAQCANGLHYSAAWAAKLPPPLSVYPRAHVQEAAGIDHSGCRMRVVNFVTPVAPGDVIDFYYTRLRAAGFGADHHAASEMRLLRGANTRQVYAILARSRDDGLTEVDLAVTGG